MEESICLEGFAAVKGALTGGFREMGQILIDPKREDRGITWLRREAERRGVVVKNQTREELDRLAENQGHGGVLAFVGQRRSPSPEELLPDTGSPFIVMLDGIEDPYNLGFAIRALWAAGVDGLILRRRDWSSATTVIARSSAGASELMPTAQVSSPDEGAEIFRSLGLKIAVTTKEKNSRSLYETDLTVPLFLLIGGERRGVKRSFLDRADLLLEIPYGRDFRQSLGAASAASILGFEVMRQRRVHREESS
ncbi:MAG: TrmH family RNA methyltransferase [Candidatus Kapaibacterium sp.]